MAIMRLWKNKLDYISMLFIIVTSGMATSYSRSIEHVLFVFCACVICLVYLKVKLSKQYFIAIALWFTYIGLSYIKYPGDNYFWPFLYFVNFTIIYTLVRFHGLSIMWKFEQVIFHLSILSLFFYFWQNYDLNSMLGVWRNLDISGSLFDKPYTYYFHTFFYTIHQFIDTSKGSVRNAGFCWEPGPFSCFVVFALFISIAINSFKLKRMVPRLIVYTLALISTQSTTGILALFVIITWYIYNLKNVKFLYFVGLPVIILVFAFTYNKLPFLKEKIEAQLQENLRQVVLNTDASEFESGLGRFQSLQITFYEFIDNPILGIGANQKSRWAAQMNLNVIPTTGIGNFMSRFGLFGIIPLLFWLWKSSQNISRLLNYKGAWVFSCLILIFGFSFNIIETPIFLTFIFYSMFSDASDDSQVPIMLNSA